MRRTQFFVTGFGPFLPDAPTNPTQILVERLRGRRNDFDFELDCRVVAVDTEAAVAAVDALAACIECRSDGAALDKTTTFLIHLGVHSSLQSFHLERCAWNEADFRIPDVAGRQMRKETICTEDGGLEHCLTTLLPLDIIAARMEELGHSCTISDDAGRFLCNYIYYHSLKLSAAVDGRERGKGTTTSLFVHVPPFTTVSQPAQERFLADLL
eukprot:CAMPEP_0198689450 /NCGR_PEP_ID=MMETSP1468-20131203/141150_1 /TAXON_ID=1461545 /ORGANISM="Mantoniella sp, Strain CCMP1436" /LENGTH=211 /DNA_ID=CAMNT_0044440485 /DNA_START=67 /DNA_END=699 /DNA_ORIENTATION=-